VSADERSGASGDIGIGSDPPAGREGRMPKYLFKVSYSAEAFRGLMKEGAANRAGFIEKLTANLGGQMEGFYFAFGPTDVFAFADLPNDTTAAALAMAVGAAGIGIETVKLLTPAEADEARAIDTGYRAPGA
jgi:uncharacterized protein with GYD domain